MAEVDGQLNMAVLIEGARELGLTLSAAQVDQFRRYQDLLLTWNRQFNLTAVRDERQIQRRHFLDSLACALATGDLNEKRLVDVGSGAGFPGLPLKILFPALRLCLVESVGKKASFLEAVVKDLQLPEVQIVTTRAEALGQDGAHRQRYDWAVARAVAKMAILVEYLLPLVSVGGHVLAQKGRSAAGELAAAQMAITLLGGGTPRVLAVQIPGEEEQTSLVVIDKIKATPEKYPRRTGIPAKRPL